MWSVCLYCLCPAASTFATDTYAAAAADLAAPGAPVTVAVVTGKLAVCANHQTCTITRAHKGRNNS